MGMFYALSFFWGTMRYQLYREHKYVSAALNDVERLAGKTDYYSAVQTARLVKEFSALADMLKAHAEYENTSLHELLKKKNSPLFHQIEKDHEGQDQNLDALQKRLIRIENAMKKEEKVVLGYQFYLAFRKFVSDNLAHLHEEETIILPELQRLYTDDELRQIDVETYRVMTSEQMVEMMRGLFPHMNASDREHFLSDIKAAQPEKFLLAWKEIKDSLSHEERTELAKKYNCPP